MATKTRALTAKQRAFIDHYFLCGLNGTEAARRAGYDGDANTLAAISSENLQKPKLRAIIDERLAKLTISADEVLARLSQQATGTMSDFLKIVEVNGANEVRLDVVAAKQNGNAHLIKKITETERKIGAMTIREVSIELYDAQAALQLLGKYHRLFTDKVEIADWRIEAVELIRKGEVKYAALVEEFGDDLATELFKQAGVPVS